MFEEEYASESDVPEAVRHLYVESDGKFVLLSASQLRKPEDVTKLQGSLDKERRDHKATKAKLSEYGEKTPEEVQDALDKLAELEAANPEGDKNDDESVKAVVEAKVKARTATLERQIKKLEDSLTEQTQLVGEFSAKESNRKIREHIREEAEKAKVVGPFVRDAVDLGVHLFEVNEAGEVVTKDGVGVTPGVGADAWLTERRDINPLWWPESQGAGSRGSEGGGGGGVNPFSAAGWNMTLQGEMIRENPKKAEQMARSAGTTVGGPRPEAKQ